MMKIAILALLAAVIVMPVANTLQRITEDPYLQTIEKDRYIRYVATCPFVENEEKVTRQTDQGTLTRLPGGAIVGPYHLFLTCELDTPIKVWPEHDLAYISYGQTGECNNLRLDEDVVFYAGFPTLKENAFEVNYDLEFDVGIVKVRDSSTRVIRRGGEVITYNGRSTTTSKRVRSGYSGGGVEAATDKRLVGIVLSGTTDGSLATYLPIETVCNLVDEANSDLVVSELTAQ